jgi:hypothetical protein
VEQNSIQHEENSMEVHNGLMICLIVLACTCLLATQVRWKLTHPRCPCCAKRIRRAFAHCPWCGLQQFHRGRPPYRRASLGKAPASRRSPREELDTLPHKRPRTIVLPEQRYAWTDQGYDTVLVPEHAVRSRVRVCGTCHAEQQHTSKRCWRCSSTILFWMERGQ